MLKLAVTGFQGRAVITKGCHLSLLWRLEDSTFEVAVFGRVSSGKSSFLDVLLQTDLLPVGANPVTAIPTRVQYGDRIKATVRLGSGALTEVSLGRFRDLVSEVGNPGNREGVRYAMLSVPSDRWQRGLFSSTRQAWDLSR